MFGRKVDLNFGKNDETIGKYAIKSLYAATQALKDGIIDVLGYSANQ